MRTQQQKLNFNEVWLMFQETKEQIKENDRILTERFKDTDKKFKDTDKKFKDTDKKFQDTDKKFQDTDKKIKELAGLFTGQWGKLVESLLSPGCIAVFQKEGIKINQLASNAQVTRDGRQMEIDVLLANGTEVVAIEVKTTARVKHIREILDDLKEFKRFFPLYSKHKVYGAIAALRFEEDCDKYAESKGLFVLKSSGEGLIKLVHSKNFKPKIF